MNIDDQQLHQVLHGRITNRLRRKILEDEGTRKEVLELAHVDYLLSAVGVRSNTTGDSSYQRWVQFFQVIRPLTSPAGLVLVAALLSLAAYASAFAGGTQHIGATDEWTRVLVRLLWMLPIGLALVLVWTLATPRLVEGARLSTRAAGALFAVYALSAFSTVRAVNHWRQVAFSDIDRLLGDHRWIGYDPVGFNPYKNQMPSEDEVVAQLKQVYDASTGRGFDGIFTFRTVGVHEQIPRLCKQVVGIRAVLMGVELQMPPRVDQAGRPRPEAEIAAELDETVHLEIERAVRAKEWVDAYVVGHNFDTWISYEKVAEWMAELRRATGRPVTTTLPFRNYVGERGEELRRMGDFSFPDVPSSPWWQGSSPEEAFKSFRETLLAIQDLPADKPVILKFVSYASGPSDMGLSEQDQARFFSLLCRNVYMPPHTYLGIALSHDVPWKENQEEWDRPEKHVGLITIDGREKPAFDMILRHWPNQRQRR
jgi:hypothetical protein